MKVATGWHELNRQCYNGHWDPRCSLQTYRRNSCMYVIFSRMWFEIIFFEIIFSLRHSAPVNGSIADRGSGSYIDGDQMKGNVTTPTRTQQQQQLALLSFSSL